LGLIGKQIRKKSNQELAAPITLTTNLPAKALGDLVKGVVATHNDPIIAKNNERLSKASGTLKKAWAESKKMSEAGNLFHIGVAQDGKTALISYQKTPAEAQKGVRYGGNQLAQVVFGDGPLDGHWLSEVKVFGPPADNPTGPNRLEISLKSWVTDRDSGKMQNKDKYEKLVDLLRIAILEADARQPTLGL
jgi:hypothetical protein